MRRIAIWALSALAAMVVAACGGATAGQSKGEIDIGSLFPSNGGDAAQGIPIQNGIEFAINQVKTVRGFTLKYVPADDTVNGTANLQKSVQNIQQYVDNSKVLGVIGTYYSTFAVADIPVANRANLAMISPSNTLECLTVPYKWCNPTPSQMRPNGVQNYFRITTSDLFQGPAMADFAYDTLNLRQVAAFSNGEASPDSMRNHFVDEFTKKGGKVVVNQSYDWKTLNDFRPLIQQAKAAGAQGIYMGGESGTKSCQARAQMKGILDVPFMGDDGMTNAQCISDAADNAAGMYNTVPSADAHQNPDAAATIAAFKAKYPNPNQEASFTFPAVDCANILIAAIGRAIDANGGNMPTRIQVVQQMAATKDYKGLTGVYSFNQYGDPTAPNMSIYESKGTPATFTWLKQFTVDPSSVPIDSNS